MLARASVLPYLVAWALYQGSLLMTVLNWTGLVVNGCVSFLLPMILVLKSIDQQQQRGRRREEHGLTGDEETARDDDDTAPVGAAPLAVVEQDESERAAAAAESAGDDAMVVVEVEEGEGERVHPLPSSVEPYRRVIVVVIIAVFVMIIGLTMVLDSLS